MTNSVRFLKREFAVWLVSMVSVSLCGIYARAANMSVTDERPVAKAIEELEHRYHVPITYEDTLYFNANDIADVTETVRLDQGVGETASRVFVPTRRTVTFALPDDAATGRSAAALAAVKSLLDSYALSEGDAAAFAVSQDSSGLHVVSRGFTDLSGQPQSLKPALDRQISITQRDRTALDALDEICRLISEQGGKVVDLGTSPNNLIATRLVNVDFKNAKAREILESISKQLGVHLSWQLFCGPGEEGCALNLHVVE